MIRDDQGREHTTNKDKAECFGRFFFTKCSLKNDLQQSNLPAFPNRSTAALSRVRFCPATVARLLRLLDTSKTTGPDGVPAQVLKICAAELSSPLSSLFSTCFRQGVYPSLWKTANFVPVHKKQARSSMRNYQPVSLLSVIIKGNGESDQHHPYEPPGEKAFSLPASVWFSHQTHCGRPPRPPKSPVAVLHEHRRRCLHPCSRHRWGL